MSDTEQHKKRRLDDDDRAAAQAAIGDSAQLLAREKEAIVKLLEPFTREQLLAILASAYVVR